MQKGDYLEHPLHLREVRFSPIIPLYQDRASQGLHIDKHKPYRSRFSSLTIRCGSRHTVCSLAIIKKTKSMINRSRLNVPSEDQHIFVIKIVRKMIVASLSDFYYFCVILALQHHIHSVPSSSEIMNLIDRIIITNIILELIFC